MVLPFVPAFAISDKEQSVGDLTDSTLPPRSGGDPVRPLQNGRVGIRDGDEKSGPSEEDEVRDIIPHGGNLIRFELPPGQQGVEGLGFVPDAQKKILDSKVRQSSFRGCSRSSGNDPDRESGSQEKGHPVAITDMKGLHLLCRAEGKPPVSQNSVNVED